MRKWKRRRLKERKRKGLREVEVRPWWSCEETAVAVWRGLGLETLRGRAPCGRWQEL